MIYLIVYDERFRESVKDTGWMKGSEFGKDNFWIGSKVDL